MQITKEGGKILIDQITKASHRHICEQYVQFIQASYLKDKLQRGPQCFELSLNGMTGEEWRLVHEAAIEHIEQIGRKIEVKNHESVIN